MADSEFLRMENILKEFPGVVANDRVDLSVRRGEIHGLLGENGAGKSTLMKILYGLYAPDGGDIYLDGTRMAFDSPQDAIDAGIGMVHQHFKLIPRLTVAENIVLGQQEPASAFRPDATESWVPAAVRNNGLVSALAERFSLGLDVPRERIQRLADSYGFDIDVDAKIWELDVGQQQRVEVLKALYRDVDLLILDEPTAVLTPTEAERLFESLERLTEEGLSIVFITHKLKEIEAIADRVTVLREGKNVGTVDADGVTRADLAEMMVGREVLFQIERDRVDLGDPVLRLEGIDASDDRGIGALEDLDLTVRAGEIVGVAGVSGNGQKELAEVTTGIRSVESGTIEVCETDLTGAKPGRYIDSGVSFVPEDRHRYGCAGDLSVMHNATMKDFKRREFGGRFLDYGELRRYAETLVEEFDVRGVEDVTETAAGDLSGGNLQKLILAREIRRNPRLLVANQPTRGVDVGAIEFIRETLLDQRTEGTGILLLSEDLDEIFDLSDRILVLYEGEFVHETTPEAASRERLGLEMTGGESETGTGSDTREATDAREERAVTTESETR